jgi:catechol 2,3-dioxygenase-like lactoylglutathione lyase family enzyme
MQPIIDHIQITVRDMAVALPFYDRLMPLLGFDPAKRSEAHVEAHELHVVEYVHPQFCIGINSPRASEAAATVHRRRPGSLHHLAFRAESRAEVDRFHEQLIAIDATIVDGPRVFPEHVPAGYYAVFFKDPDGIKYEVVHY